MADVPNAERELRFNERTIRRLLILARNRVRPFVPSRTLRRDVQLIVNATNRKGFLQWPYYWAGMIHAGYDTRFPVVSSVLIWFKNKRDDPRTQGASKYPRRRRDIRRLTDAQYQEGLKRNRQRPRNNPYMIVVRYAGGAAPRPFIDQGLRGFSSEAGRLVKQEWGKLVSEIAFSDKDTARARI